MERRARINHIGRLLASAEVEFEENAYSDSAMVTQNLFDERRASSFSFKEGHKDRLVKSFLKKWTK